MRQLAQKAGVSTSTVSRAENGEIIPKPDTLSKLARCLPCSLNDLLITAGHIPPDINGDDVSAGITGTRRPEKLCIQLCDQEIDRIADRIADRLEEWLENNKRIFTL